MKPDNHEYFEIYDGKLYQITYRVKTEQMYIDLVKYFDSQGWDMPDNLLDRADIAINRLLQFEAIHG